MKIGLIDVALVGAAVFLFVTTPGFPDELVPLAIEAMHRRWVKL